MDVIRSYCAVAAHTFKWALFQRVEIFRLLIAEGEIFRLTPVIDSVVICVVQKPCQSLTLSTVMAGFQRDVQASVFNHLSLCQHSEVWKW